MRRVAMVLALLVAAPLGAVAQGPQDGGGSGAADTITFYGHVFGVGLHQPMPANTEFPEGEDNLGTGLYTYCTPVANAHGLVPTPTDQAGCENDDWNVLALYSTAGFVDVKGPSDFAQNGGYSLLHNERGQTKDLLLDTSQAIQAGVWLTVDLHSWSQSQGETGCVQPHPEDVPCLYPYWGWDPGVAEGFVVQATLAMAKLGEHGESASEAPPIREAWNNGEATILAEGAIGPMQVINGLPGYENVYEYVVDLGPSEIDRIPRENDFFVLFRFNQEVAGTAYDDARWRVWAGEFFPPWFTLPTENPLDVERVVPTWAHGKLAVLAIMNTPWGSYDVADADLTITNARGEAPTDSLFEFAKSSVAHGGHYLPINKTWVWDPNEDRVGPGTYTFTVTATNHQGSSESSCQAEVKLVRNEVDQTLVIDEMTPGICGDQSDGADLLAAELQEEVS